MSVELVGTKHALCVECGDVVHVAWGGASDHQMAVLGWSARLAHGCYQCGGRLTQLDMPECRDCREFLLEEWA